MPRHGTHAAGDPHPPKGTSAHVLAMWPALYIPDRSDPIVDAEDAKAIAPHGCSINVRSFFADHTAAKKGDSYRFIIVGRAL